MNKFEKIIKELADNLKSEYGHIDELDELKTEYDKLEIKINQLNIDKLELQRNIECYKSQVVELKEKLKTNESYNKRLEIKIDNEIEDHKIDLETKDKEIERYQKERLEIIHKKCTDCIIVQTLRLEVSRLTIELEEREEDDPLDNVHCEDLDNEGKVELDPTDLD